MSRSIAFTADDVSEALRLLMTKRGVFDDYGNPVHTMTVRWNATFHGIQAGLLSPSHLAVTVTLEAAK